MGNQIILSVLELSLAILLGVFSMFITHFMLVRIYKSKYPNEEQSPYRNQAFMIFLAGAMFSVGYLLTGVIEPLSSTLDLLMGAEQETGKLIWAYSKFLFLFIGLGFVLGLLINLLSYVLFSTLTTSVNELEEIKNGNIGVAVLVSVMAITIAVFCKEPFLLLLESFVPYPDLPRLF